MTKQKQMKPVEINYTEFRKILEADVVTIHHLSKFFKRDQMDFDEFGNVFVGFSEETKGLPILVAHTDNVLDGPKEPVFDLNRRFISGKEHGIGFDDKAGIMAIISLWRYFKTQKFRIIFPADEEVGGVGSDAMDDAWYNDAPWILELDRRGSKDFIQVSGGTRLCSDEFAKKFLDMGFEDATGTFTDVNNFKENTGWINMANISIGYYEPHTDKEYLDTVAFEQIVNKVAKFIAADYTFEPDKPDEKPVTTSYGSTGFSFQTPTGDFSKRCTNCGGACDSNTMVYNKWGERFCCKECLEEDERDYMESYGVRNY